MIGRGIRLLVAAALEHRLSLAEWQEHYFDGIEKFLSIEVWRWGGEYYFISFNHNNGCYYYYLLLFASILQ
jgi:hypothetical protein